jgi:hypothetical protein
VSAEWSERNPGPGARHGAFGSWDGSGFLIWGGYDVNTALADGKRWMPESQTAAGGAWQDVTPNVARRRAVRYRETGWTVSIAPGKTLMVGGGGDLASYENDAASYDANTRVWTDLGAWPSGSLHLYGVGAWTGSEFVLWGGRPAAGAAPTSQGHRLRP